MERSQFNSQIERLKDQWPNSYGDERKALLYNAFRNCSDSSFSSAISECIARHRSAPLLDELSKAVEIAKVEESAQGLRGTGSFFGIMQKGIAVNTTANPLFLKDCSGLLESLIDKKISLDDFQRGCDLLDIAAKSMA